jgi:UDP-3-O-[3-hydroxymyristoyl] glucosamine N-acyltransferase
MSMTVSELAGLLDAHLEGEGDFHIHGVSSLEEARDGDISFAEKTSFLARVLASRASAVVVNEGFPAVAGKSLLRVQNPKEAFVRLMRLFYKESGNDPPGISPAAQISSKADVGDAVHIGPCVVIKAGARIGAGTSIDAGCIIDHDVVIGRTCKIGPNVTLMRGVLIGHHVTIQAGSVIGGDGFGYVWLGDALMKVPQFGGVVIEDNVDIGSNVCIDRATFGVTRIRRGAKIDNLVQVGHNCDIGEHALLVSQVGLSGSVTVGAGAVLAGQVGVTDHTNIGERARIGGASAVTKNVRDGETVWGSPARPMKEVLREKALIKRMPDLLLKIRNLEAQIAELRKKLSQSD